MQLIELSLNQNYCFQLVVSPWLIVIGSIAIIIISLFRLMCVRRLRIAYEINEAEIGIGSTKIKIRPNKDDLQMGYQLWVELKTRKLGIVFDEERDVIHEVYNSWYQFFTITRELLKTIPVQKVRSSADTRKLINLSMKILNDGLRPHLTTWQSKYRRWYEHEVQESGNKGLSPQGIQKKYPEYTALVADMKRVNGILVKYTELLELMINKELN